MIGQITGRTIQITQSASHLKSPSQLLFLMYMCQQYVSEQKKSFSSNYFSVTVETKVGG